MASDESGLSLDSLLRKKERNNREIMRVLFSKSTMNGRKNPKKHAFLLFRTEENTMISYEHLSGGEVHANAVMPCLNLSHQFAPIPIHDEREL
jgi:hypothetical protein